jgi:hypothetical protein
LILDASESAVLYQPAIIALVRELLSALPARVECALYFLGNPSPYPAANFDAHTPRWFGENRRRASLITPLWETCAPDDLSTQVVIGAGRIFDLEDWRDTALLKRAILVNMGEKLRAEQEFRDEPNVVEELAQPSAARLLERLHDPVVGVEITAPGFLPLAWDNPRYQLRLSGGEASLVAGRQDDYALALRYLATQPGQATLTRASNERTTQPLAPTETGKFREVEEGWLSAGEVALFRRAIRREPFTCLRCGQLHPWNLLRCVSGGSILGEAVYPSLAARKASGFVIFREAVEGVRYELHPDDVLRLGVAEAAVREGPRAARYAFDDPDAGWARAAKALEPYHSLGEGAYVALL